MFYSLVLQPLSCKKGHTFDMVYMFAEYRVKEQTVWLSCHASTIVTGSDVADMRSAHKVVFGVL